MDKQTRTALRDHAKAPQIAVILGFQDHCHSHRAGTVARVGTVATADSKIDYEDIEMTLWYCQYWKGFERFAIESAGHPKAGSGTVGERDIHGIGQRSSPPVCDRTTILYQTAHRSTAEAAELLEMLSLPLALNRYLSLYANLTFARLGKNSHELIWPPT